MRTNGVTVCKTDGRSVHSAYNGYGRQLNRAGLQFVPT